MKRTLAHVNVYLGIYTDSKKVANYENMLILPKGIEKKEWKTKWKIRSHEC